MTEHEKRDTRTVLAVLYCDTAALVLKSATSQFQRDRSRSRNDEGGYGRHDIQLLSVIFDVILLNVLFVTNERCLNPFSEYGACLVP